MLRSKHAVEILCVLFLVCGIATVIRCQNDEEETTTLATDDGEELTATPSSVEPDNAEETEAPPPDYSQWAVPTNGSEGYPEGGILIQYTQPGLDYIISMVQRASSKLMRDFPIPDTEEGGYAVKNVKVKQFDDPIFKAKFINNTGIEIQTIIPKLEISAGYSAGSGWFSTKGTVNSNIDGLVVSMLVRIVRGKTGFPSLDIPVCSGKVKKFRVFFADAGWAGTILNTLRGFMESIFVTSMGNVVCFAARNLTGLIETVFLDFDKPMSEILAGPANKSAGATEGLELNVICGEQPVAQPQTPAKRGSGGFASGALAEMDDLSLDMRMDQDGRFEDRDAIMGLRGEFLHVGKRAGVKPRQVLKLPPTDRSLCFAVSEMVPNSFGIQAQNNGLFVLNKKIELDDFPRELRTPLRLLCGKCNLKLYASTAEAPRFEFSKSGVRAYSKTFMRIDGRGLFNTKIKIVEAVANIEGLTKLFIDKNTIKGSISLGSIQIKIHNMGLAGLFGKPLNVLLRGIIPKVIWPAVEKRINKLLTEKGFPMPAVCGLSFNNSQIIYTDGDVVVCTDFVYDIDGFLDRFTKWQRMQSLAKGGSPAAEEHVAELPEYYLRRFIHLFLLCCLRGVVPIEQYLPVPT